MIHKSVVHNIRVEHLLKLLSGFRSIDYIDVSLIPGDESSSDILRISLSVPLEEPTREWFDLRRLNDFI